MVQPLPVIADITRAFCKLPRTTVFLTSGFLVTLLWLIICFVSRLPGPFAVLQFLLCTLLIVICTLATWWHASNNQYALPVRWIVLSALLLRLLSLTGEPLFEDDHYRYMWDGYMTATTGDPYSLAPESFFDADVPEVFEPVLSLINYPQIATVYGPVTEWIFAIAYQIKAASIWPLQLLAGLADMLVLLLLWRMGAGNGMLLYAWSPLILKEFSLTTHPDIYAIALVLAACLASARSRPVIAGIALGLAIGTKIFAVLVVPFLLLGAGNLRQRIQQGGLMLTAIVGCLTAVTVWYGTVEIWVPEGLRAMADSWLFNAPVYMLLLNFFDFHVIKLLLLSSFLGGVIIALAKRLRQPHSPLQAPDNMALWAKSGSAFRGDWLFAAFILSLPVVNPWYVAWLLPFAALYPRWWSWSAGTAVLLSYYYGSYIAASGQSSLQLSSSVIAVEYAIVLAVSLIAWLMRRRHQPQAH